MKFLVTCWHGPYEHTIPGAVPDVDSVKIGQRQGYVLHLSEDQIGSKLLELTHKFDVMLKAPLPGPTDYRLLVDSKGYGFKFR